MIYDTLPMRHRSRKMGFFCPPLPCLSMPSFLILQVVGRLPKPKTLGVWTLAGSALHMWHPSVPNCNCPFLTPSRQPPKKIDGLTLPCLFPRAVRHQAPVSVGRCPRAPLHNPAIGVPRQGTRVALQVDQGQAKLLGTRS